MPGEIDPRLAAVANRCKSIRTELNRLDDAVMELDASGFRSFAEERSLDMRVALDALESVAEQQAALG